MGKWLPVWATASNTGNKDRSAPVTRAPPNEGKTWKSRWRECKATVEVTPARGEDVYGKYDPTRAIVGYRPAFQNFSYDLYQGQAGLYGEIPHF
jgi:hypothetical protein